MRNKKEAQKKKAVALSEIFLMVMATVAIAFVMQQSMGMASAQDNQAGNPENPSANGAFTPAVTAARGATTTGGAAANTPTFSKGTVPPEASEGGAAMLPATTSVPTGVQTVDRTGAAVSGKNLMSVSGWSNSKFINVDSKLTSNGVSLSQTTPVSIKPNADGTSVYTYKDASGSTQTTTLTKEGTDQVKTEISNQGGTLNSAANAANIGKGLFEGVIWAAAVFGLTQMLAGAFGASDNLKNALSVSLAVGVLVWKGVSTLNQGSKFWSGGGAIIAGLVAAAVVFFLMYKEEKQRVITFSCDPYQPPLGGKQCEECNKYPFKPCSIYRCKSLGQACELLNVGTANESCAWVSKFDTTSPIISTWKDALYPVNLQYNPDTSRPSGLGSTIIKTNGTTRCLDAFTPLKFGITTNEPSQCKIDYVHTNNYANMTFMFGESNLFLYNHSQSMKLPAPDTSTNLSGSPSLFNDGTYILYVRCIDANGNQNVDEYTFKFCVDKSPDTTPPVVVSTSIVSGSPVQFNVSNVPIQVYTNEPATCRWSRMNKDYIDMEYNMSCSNSIMKVNSDLVYACTSNLTGIVDKQTNSFYFRCKDNPTKADKDRNVMSQSYPLIIRGSQSLNIVNSGPNSTIYGSTDVTTVNLTVETDDGSDSGKALCYYSTSGNNGDYVLMYETNNSVRHVQQLDLNPGTYTYYYRCIDAGGNRAETNTTFTVFVDKAMPLVTRVYKDNPDALKVVTDEDAECAYSLTSCNFNFDEGTKMIYNPVDVKNALFAQWKDNAVYYIKCRDQYGNEPSPNQCNIVVSAAKLVAVS